MRLTGGEPLVSRRIIPLIRDIRAIPQIEDISLTTNGALLPKLAPQLKDAGLDRVNISLDTLDPTLFGKDHAPGSARADHGWHRRGAGLGL